MQSRISMRWCGRSGSRLEVEDAEGRLDLDFGNTDELRAGLKSCRAGWLFVGDSRDVNHRSGYTSDSKADIVSLLLPGC